MMHNELALSSAVFDEMFKCFISPYAEGDNDLVGKEMRARIHSLGGEIDDGQIRCKGLWVSGLSPKPAPSRAVLVRSAQSDAITSWPCRPAQSESR